MYLVDRHKNKGYSHFMKIMNYKTLNYLCLIPLFALPIIFWFTFLNVYRVTKNQFKAGAIVMIPTAICFIALVLIGGFIIDNMPKWISNKVLSEVMQFMLIYVVSIMLSIICVAIHKNYMRNILEQATYQEFIGEKDD